MKSVLDKRSASRNILRLEKVHSYGIEERPRCILEISQSCLIQRLSDLKENSPNLGQKTDFCYYSSSFETVNRKTPI